MEPTPGDHLAALARCAVPLPSEPHPCGYLEGRIARDEAWYAFRLRPESYHDLMNRNFRRAGNLVYRPVCEGCRRCVQLRVPVATFRPSRSQRRCLKRNADLTLRVGEPRLTVEKHALYRRYLERRHPGSQQPADVESLRGFLYTSCVRTLEVEYRDGAGRLVGVSLVDVAPRALSSVYHFFAPEEAWRSMGNFSALAEIDLCRQRGIPHYYLGYYVAGCRSMEYKAGFRPHEVLVDGVWRAGERNPTR